MDWAASPLVQQDDPTHTAPCACLARGVVRRVEHQQPGVGTECRLQLSGVHAPAGRVQLHNAAGRNGGAGSMRPASAWTTGHAAHAVGRCTLCTSMAWAWTHRPAGSQLSPRHCARSPRHGQVGVVEWCKEDHLGTGKRHATGHQVRARLGGHSPALCLLASCSQSPQLPPMTRCLCSPHPQHSAVPGRRPPAPRSPPRSQASRFASQPGCPHAGRCAPPLPAGSSRTANRVLATSLRLARA